MTLITRSFTPLSPLPHISYHGLKSIAKGYLAPYATLRMKTNQAFVALGSNVGDRVGMIEAALRAMETRKIKVIRASSLWETKPMYVVNQEDFINGVCEVNCPKLDLVLVSSSCVSVLLTVALTG